MNIIGTRHEKLKLVHNKATMLKQKWNAESEEQASTPKFAKDNISVSDIEGAQPKSLIKKQTEHDPLYIGDIEGSSPKKVLKMYNTLDATHSSKKKFFVPNPPYSPTMKSEQKKTASSLAVIYDSVVHQSPNSHKREIELIHSMGQSAAKILRG